MKIVIETKEDRAVILAAMDCVAKHMGYQGLPILNIMNTACEGLDCTPKPVITKVKDKVTKKDSDAG